MRQSPEPPLSSIDLTDLQLSFNIFGLRKAMVKMWSLMVVTHVESVMDHLFGWAQVVLDRGGKTVQTLLYNNIMTLKYNNKRQNIDLKIMIDH